MGSFGDGMDSFVMDYLGADGGCYGIGLPGAEDGSLSACNMI